MSIEVISGYEPSQSLIKSFQQINQKKSKSKLLFVNRLETWELR